MPNPRRRRFSVQNDIGGRGSSKTQNGLKTSVTEDTKTIENKTIPMKNSKSKNKMFAHSSKNWSSSEIVAEREISSSIIINNSKTTVDKDITASSSNIDQFYIRSVDDSSTVSSVETTVPKKVNVKEREARPINREKAQLKREKYPRQHRIKVRSPKRRLPVMDHKATENIRKSIGTGPIGWEEEETPIVCIEPVSTETLPPDHEEQQRLSNHSLDDMCRICHGGDSLTNELGQLISACACRGTVGRVHVKCLERWLTESGKSRCELCGTRYATRRVHKYGVPRALLMWVLSQNAKQLMVDSLGIMLMSPLAVLAAWLSGRTLAGLMIQDSTSMPWPLASTFVLACMTLVCYYCWIVSAATRHALGWWIWYRSQYEVRLQFQESEE